MEHHEAVMERYQAVMERHRVVTERHRVVMERREMNDDQKTDGQMCSRLEHQNWDLSWLAATWYGQ